MTTAHDIYVEATKRGLRLEPAGDKLAVMPKGKCPPDFANVLREHKGELLNWLTRQPCPGWGAIPPADPPLNPIMPRPTPENRERVISYIFRQGDGRPCPLYAWIVKRECAYYDRPGRKWDCALHAYAAARDAACWQLNRSESDVWQLLSTFDECRENLPRSGGAAKS